MDNPEKKIRPLILLVVATGIALLVVEGGISLFAGLTFKSLWSSRSPLEEMAHRAKVSAEKIESENRQGSGFRFHPDPRVGYVLDSADELTFYNATTHPDPLGMRSRPGPPPPDDALRIVVLGDSVAFGLGLNDYETIAAALEGFLNGMRGPGDPPVACWTLAVPGWNHRNAVNFLFNHIDFYDPDLVIYLPVPNDLADTYALDEAGLFRLSFDLCNKDPWLCVNLESVHLFPTHFLEQHAKDSIPNDQIKDIQSYIGPIALTSDLTPESRVRYDENADSIEKLAAICSKRGTKLLIATYIDPIDPCPYSWSLMERLFDHGFDGPVIPLWPDFKEGVDAPAFISHPDFENARIIAAWFTATLMKLGWIGPSSETGVSPWIDKIAQNPGIHEKETEFRAKASAFRQEAMNRLNHEVNLDTGKGYQQIYGGFNPDGTMGPRLLAMLKAGAGEVQVRLAALPEASQLYPLEIGVEIQGEPIGKITVQDPDREPVAEAWFAIPPCVEKEEAMEIRLVSAEWVQHSYKEKRYLACCRLLSLRSVAHDER